MSRDVFTPRNLMTVGEMSSTSLEHCQQYAALDGRELSMTFNFHHLKVDYPGGEKWTLARPDYVALKALFRHWQQGMHNRAWNALFWCNHDQPRIVSRFGDEGEYRVTAAKMLAMVLHGMQGTPYIYQGEEIGMTNPHFSSISDYRDVESHNMFIERAAQGQSRTNCWRSSPASRATTAARRCRGTPARTVASATVSRGSALAIITRRSTSRRRWRTPIRCFMPISS